MLLISVKNRRIGNQRRIQKYVYIVLISLIIRNPLHPSYLPTIFPGKVNIKKSVQSVQRFERQKRRLNRVIIEQEIVNNNHIEMEQHDCEEINVKMFQK